MSSHSSPSPPHPPPFPTGRERGKGGEVAPHVLWCDLGFVNVYFVGEPNGPWAIIDTATPMHFEAIRQAAAERFGKEARPEAIYLTHGHGDHVGSALALATYYDVPIYVHRMELPYVTGRANYPPLDPTVGGTFGFLTRFVRPAGVDLGEWVRPLPEDGTLPGLTDWQVIEAPGHAPGQVAFYRPKDRTLIAGDACTTMNLDHLPSILARKREIAKPPSAATPDWVSARKSARRLAALSPRVLACGHGIPMIGNAVPTKLAEFAEHFIIPLKGRYVSEPARFDENGVTYLPPAVSDPLPKILLGVGAVAAGVTLYSISAKRRNRMRDNG